MLQVDLVKCYTDHFYYNLFKDVRELVELEDVMEAEDLRLGPNGGLLFCME